MDFYILETQPKSSFNKRSPNFILTWVEADINLDVEIMEKINSRILKIKNSDEK